MKLLVTNSISLRTTAILMPLAVCAVFLSGPALSADVVLDEIAAVVNDGVVLQSDIAAETRFQKLQAKATRQAVPPAAELRKLILNGLINREVQKQRAQRAGIEIDQASVNRAIDKVASTNNMNSFEFRQQLQKQGFDYAHYRNSIAHELLLTRLVRREVQDSITVTEKEIDDFLAKEKGLQDEIIQYKIRHIIITANADSSAAQVEQAERKISDLLVQLRDGANFAILAKKESNGSRASDGGDLGWREAVELPAFITAALESLDKGELSETLRSADGFHLIKLEDKRSNLDQVASEETRLRHIFLEAASESDNNAARITLTGLRQRITAGESFSELASEFSQDPDSKDNGGELPWLSQGQMPLPMEEAASELAAGQLSQPFKTQFGWHLVEVLERRAASSPDSKLRNEASLVLKERKFEQEVDRWQRRLRSESFVEILK